MENIQIRAFSTQEPPYVMALRNSHSEGTAVFVYRESKELFSVEPNIKPRTVEALVNHALTRLEPFGIKDLVDWATEVYTVDESYCVCFTNQKGASLEVCGIVLTPNRCGVVCDFGIVADIN